MKESVKKRIEAVRRGEVPEGYGMERAMLFPNEWGKPVALATVLSENKERNEDLRFGKDDVLSVSGEQGIVNQIDLLGRSYAGESVAPYHVVETGDVVYTKSPLKENPYGIIKQNRGVPGIVSTLYAVYHCISPVTGQYVENYFCVDSFLNNYLKPLVKRGAKNDMKVNNEDVLLGRIPLPPIQEQKRINEILAHYDRMTELKQKLLEEKHKTFRYIMTLLFERSDVYTELGRIAKITMGQSPDSSSYNTDEDGVPLLQGNADIINRFPAPRYYTNQPTKMCVPGDLLLSVRAPVGEVSRSNLTACIGRGLCAISAGKFTEYIFYYLRYYEPKWNKISQGSTFTAISGDDIKKVQVPVFDDTTLIHNGDILRCADNEIRLLQQEIKAWQQKKKALMQLLLTGLVRVNA